MAKYKKIQSTLAMKWCGKLGGVCANSGSNSKGACSRMEGLTGWFGSHGKKPHSKDLIAPYKAKEALIKSENDAEGLDLEDGRKGNVKDQKKLIGVRLLWAWIRVIFAALIKADGVQYSVQLSDAASTYHWESVINNQRPNHKWKDSSFGLEVSSSQSHVAKSAKADFGRRGY
ncbi:hypothetical protein CROQUDRAFT_135288 [Cronartium quercuum f. sp. fusiforme G11]|uniref:Uncharacterized protein n=1 Tax=Cronartium quercuum f. sp. fusiforme G11 TaxID=708437 RepID=A0A9P6NEX0_9BASI|nr:hypothetical protein CROQUDRAFT_135288 [Cronartium quercuum f. sp. fusiforme G11]